MLESLLASAVLPAVIDLVKGAGGAVSRKFLGLSVDDQIKLDTSSVEKLRALAELDNPYGTPSQWVVDLRASYRYIAATVIPFLGLSMVGATMVVPTMDGELKLLLVQQGFTLIGMPFAFVFGERMYIGMKGGKK